MMTSHAERHEESWLLLPWLANGRLPHAERAAVEEHLRECPSCSAELARQHLMCEALTAPERVTYAPGPSFRKLLERIDGQPQAATRPRPAARPVAPQPAVPARTGTAAWRPPGLAWAASVLLVCSLAVVGTMSYRWGQPRYATHTTTPRGTPGVLHVAFDHALPLGELEQLLRAAGAHIVEGPDSVGVFGVAPAGTAPSADPAAQLGALAARLRADGRVRWVEPLTAADAPAGAPARSTPEP